jgi:hypothetical protein
LQTTFNHKFMLPKYEIKSRDIAVGTVTGWRTEVSEFESRWGQEFFKPIAVAALSKAWTAFARSNTGIMGSNPTRGMDVCVRLFCVCLVWVALRRTDPPSKQSTVCVQIKELKKRPRSTRAVEP